MNRKNNCIACRYQKDGVKTRKALVHTCGKDMRCKNPELPEVNSSKNYFLGADLYDNRPGNLGAICVMSRNEDDLFIVEYSVTTKPEEFEEEIERIAEHFNAVIWRTLI